MARKSGGIRISTGTLAIALILVFLAWHFGLLSNLTSQSVVGTEGGVAVTKPLKFAVSDKWKGQAISGATIEVYKGDTLLETLTTDTNGLALTNRMYKSGETIHVHVVGPDGAELWKDITVPYLSKADAESLQYIQVPIDFYNLGTYTIQVMDSNGNVYTNGQTINVTSLSSPILTLTVTIYNTEDDSGFMESYNPILGEERAAYLIMTASGTGYDKLSVSGFSAQKDTSTRTVFFSKVPADALVRDKVGNTYKSTGTYSFTVTIDTSALAAGDQVTLSFNLKLLADGNLYLQKNVWSSETPIDAASFSIILNHP